MSKIIQLQVTPNDQTWQGVLLGLGADGKVYSVGPDGQWRVLVHGVADPPPERRPTHRCKVCGALWIDYPDSWSLFSNGCGKCCDNVRMGEQIEKLPFT